MKQLKNKLQKLTNEINDVRFQLQEKYDIIFRDAFQPHIEALYNSKDLILDEYGDIEARYELPFTPSSESLEYLHNFLNDQGIYLHNNTITMNVAMSSEFFNKINNVVYLGTKKICNTNDYVSKDFFYKILYNTDSDALMFNVDSYGFATLDQSYADWRNR